MDIYIIFSSIAQTLFFVVVHAFYLRLKKPAAIIASFLHSFIVTIIFSTLFELFILSWSWDGAIALVLSFTLTSLFILSYILGVFGMMMASLRVRILEEVVHAGIVGTTEKQLLSRYNRETVMKQRIERLIAGGEIRKKDGKFFLHNRFSLFRIHGGIFTMMRKMYGIGRS